MAQSARTQKDQDDNGAPRPGDLTLSFRRATKADMPRVMEIFEKSFKDQCPAYEMPLYRMAFAAEINNPRAQFTVAVQRGKIGGFSIVNADTYKDAAYLEVIGVDPAARRSGIGKGLMQEAEKTTARFDMPLLAFHVRFNNVSALDFYKKCGYTATGIVRGLYPWDGMDAVVMAKQVAAQAQDNAKTTKTAKITR